MIVKNVVHLWNAFKLGTELVAGCSWDNNWVYFR